MNSQYDHRCSNYEAWHLANEANEEAALMDDYLEDVELIDA